MTAPTSPRSRLLALVERNRALQQAQDADSRFDAQLKVLQAWQCERLLRTHADLANDARYGPGVRFFVEDLYAPKDFTARDTDIERALPAMVRLLPNRVLDTAADAAGLYVLTRELDAAMVHALFDVQGAATVDVGSYAEAYRICDAYDRRRQQIDVIASLAERLDRLVRSRLIYTTLRMTRAPAQLAGLGALQDFLERGFSAFHHMGGSADFVRTIGTRERKILDRIFANHPEPMAI